MNASERVLDAFDQRFGSPPLGTWSSPGRVNIIGEHTDYNEGFVLPFAIPHRTHVAVGPRTDRRLCVYSSDLNQSEEIELDNLSAEALSGWSAYPLGVAWALGDRGYPLDGVAGLNIAIASDVPMGAGLSSSAALETATALALSETWELGCSRDVLAHIGQRAENIAVGANTGIMDQMASLMATQDHAVFLDCRSLEHKLIPCEVEKFGLSWVVLDTNTRHSHAEGEYGNRRASCELAALTRGVPALRDLSPSDLSSLNGQLDDVTFRRARHIITENERVKEAAEALGGGNFATLGRLLISSHESMRDDFEISTRELNTQVEVACEVGALGARMTGGGFGGSVIALIDTSLVGKLQESSSERCRSLGFGQPTVTVVRASTGALGRAT